MPGVTRCDAPGTNRDGDPRTVLSALGGADIAAATGLLLGAASRRLPVMIDGPVGAAAAMLANDFAPLVRRWLMLPDTGRNVAVIVAAEALELRPWLDLCLDLGEGATSLSALPLLQTALTLAGAGEPVEPGPLTRFDSTTGGQVFVGVARPVEPSEEVEEEPRVISAALTAPTTSIGAKAKGAARPAPPKPTPVKAAKAAAAKAKGAAKTTPAKATPTKDAATGDAAGRDAAPKTRSIHKGHSAHRSRRRVHKGRIAYPERRVHKGERPGWGRPADSFAAGRFVGAEGGITGGHGDRHTAGRG